MEETELRHSDNVLVNGTQTPLKLTAGGQLTCSDWSLTVEKQVLGFKIEGSKVKVKAIVNTEDASIGCFGYKKAPVRKTFVFEPLSKDSLQIWSFKLHEYIHSLGRPERLFIFVNPFGGKKSASKIFLDDVQPLLQDANIEYTVQETRYQRHAKECTQTLDLMKYDGIVCVSGDGILVEVVNGLLEREDWDDAIKMPLGVVPAGTGNGMIKSLLDSVGDPCTASNAILAVIRGHKCSLDIATILQGETRFFSVLMLAWGLVADIDIESERYRWMGSARIDFYALQRIFHVRKYDGRIMFVPAPGFESQGEPSSQKGESIGISNICNSSQEMPVNLHLHGYRGPNVDLETLNWRQIDGPFISVWLHNVPWGGEDTMAAPDAKFSDGYLDLILIRDCPKLSLLALMTELNNGGHVKSPYVSYLKVKAFILEPGPRADDPTKEGIIDVDGEVLARGKGTYQRNQKALMAYDKLQITVDQGLATIFCPI